MGSGIQDSGAYPGFQEAFRDAWDKDRREKWSFSMVKTILAGGGRGGGMRRSVCRETMFNSSEVGCGRP